MKKQVIAKLLVLCMVLSMLPITALALGGIADDESIGNNGHAARDAGVCGGVCGDQGDDDADADADADADTDTDADVVVDADDDDDDDADAVEVAETATVEGDVASVSMNEEDLEKAIEQALASKDGAVTLEIKLPAGTTAVAEVKVDLPTAALAKLAASATSSLTMNLPVKGSGGMKLALGNKALKQLTAGAGDIGLDARSEQISCDRGEVDGYTIELTKGGSAVTAIEDGFQVAVDAAGATAAFVVVDGIAVADETAVVEGGVMTVTLPGSASFFTEK